MHRNCVNGIHAAAEIRNHIAHPQFREGLTVADFRQAKRQLTQVLVSLTGSSYADAGNEVSSSCDKPISTSAVQQIFQNMQVLWGMQVMLKHPCLVLMSEV